MITHFSPNVARRASRPVRFIRNFLLVFALQATMTGVLLGASPVAVDDHITTDEDQPVAISLPFLAANDYDPDGDPVTVYSAGSVVNGQLAYVSGNLTFTPTVNFSGTASFAYSIHDGHGGTDSATVFIHCTPVNDPPVNVVVSNLDASEDTLKALSLRVDDVDAGNASFSLRLTVSNGVLNVFGGTASINGSGTADVRLAGTLSDINSTLGATVIFSPPANFFGPVPFSMQTIELDALGNQIGDTDQLTINVASVNDPLIAVDDYLVTAKNESCVISLPALTANDYDPDGDPITAFSASTVANGSLAYIGGKLTFSPNSDFVGIGSFTLGVQDGHGAAAYSKVWILVGLPPPTLTSPAKSSGSTFRFYLNGQTGVPYRVQTSTNLVQWTPWKTIPNSTGSMLVEDNEAASVSRFYRVLIGP